MPKPTFGGVYNELWSLSPSSVAACQAAARRIVALIDTWAAEDAEERERGRRALSIVEDYADHSKSCGLVQRGDNCDCGFEGAIASLRVKETAIASTEAAASRTKAEWDYADLEEASDSLEQFNRDQRLRREVYAEALGDSHDEQYLLKRERARRAAVRYPLKRRVPATVEDPHGCGEWRLLTSDELVHLPTMQHRRERSLVWRLAHRSSHVIEWTADRVRALAALLVDPWVIEEDTSVEETEAAE